MAPEPIQQWSVDNVCTWLTAIGLGSKAEAFQENGVDGNLLCSLTKDDLTNDLSLSGLQAKKVLLEIEFAQGLTSGGGGGADPAELEALQSQLAEKDTKIAQLEQELAALKQPEPPVVHATPAPAPRPAPPPQYRHEPRVIKGAAGKCDVCISFRWPVSSRCFFLVINTLQLHSNHIGGAAR